MKWIGQHIFDFISRFRDDLHIEKKLYDSSGSSGSDGQVLKTTGNTITWVDASTISSSTYTHNQSSISHTWTITHSLNRYPSVTVVDSGNTVVAGTIVYNSANQLTVTFFSGGNTLQFSGKAYLN